MSEFTEAEKDAMRVAMSKAILKQMMSPGWEVGDALVVLENVVYGVCHLVLEPGAERKVLKIMVKNVTSRLAQQRFAEMKTEGRA